MPTHTPTIIRLIHQECRMLRTCICTRWLISVSNLWVIAVHTVCTEVTRSKSVRLVHTQSTKVILRTVCMPQQVPKMFSIMWTIPIFCLPASLSDSAHGILHDCVPVSVHHVVDERIGTAGHPGKLYREHIQILEQLAEGRVCVVENLQANSQRRYIGASVNTTTRDAISSTRPILPL